MSGEYVELLRKRSAAFLKEAKRVLKEEPDLAAFFAEQAAQLYVKSALVQLYGEDVRVHEIRKLLGELARGLPDAHREKVIGFIKRKRYELYALEEAYREGRYGPRTFEAEEAEELIKIAEEVIELVKEVIRNV